MKRINLLAPVLVLATLFLLPACTAGFGTTDEIDSGIVVEPATSEGSDTTGDTASDNSLLGAGPVDLYVESSTRAVVSSGIEVLDAPDGRPLTTLAPTTAFGSTRVLLVEQRQGDWVKVRLPARPNHRSGWIPAADVELETVDLAVYVDLQTKTLSVRSGDEVVVRSPIAVGTPENPTPLGTFYVTDKLETPDPGGGYGPFALGLSGYSETLTEFAGGDGQIGIHGTNDPGSIGQAVSHGCVRLPNDVIEALATLLPLGTPVHIV